MPATKLPWRLDFNPEALERINEAHGNTDADGTPRRQQTLLLGPEFSPTASLVVNGKVNATSEVLGTALMRYAEATGMDWRDAIPHIIRPVRTGAGVEAELEVAA